MAANTAVPAVLQPSAALFQPIANHRGAPSTAMTVIERGEQE